MAEELKSFLRREIERLEKLIRDAEEAIKIAEKMGINVEMQKAELERRKRQLAEWKEVISK